MTEQERRKRIEFGDFQTPDDLARTVCARLKSAGIRPDAVIEPTCGVGSFVIAAAEAFPSATHLLGFDINASYLDRLTQQVEARNLHERVELEQADFFATDWSGKLRELTGTLLVIGNFPWVTNAGQGAIGGSNLPEKSNFLGHSGLDAITGKANFDISEWMLLDVLRWLHGRKAVIAMLVKTAVARKVLAHAARQNQPVAEAYIATIDAKKSFGAAVDACLMVMHLDPTTSPRDDYTVFDSLDAATGRRVGHRQGLTVGDLDAFDRVSFLSGESPQKWRSGIKHDAASLMEFTRHPHGYENGLGETVQLEDTYLFPLLKGSDVGSSKEWRQKFVLVTQRAVGESTDAIQHRAPQTWSYLMSHATQLDGRGSTIYAKNPRFSIFGVGDYAFRPWRIAICGLYKSLTFRLVGPIEGRPAMFDDTVYYVSFDTKEEAEAALQCLTSKPALSFLSSLIFWDEKRPIKTSILNLLDWTRVRPAPQPEPALS